MKDSPPPRGRLLLGGVIFVTGFLCPLLVPLVTTSGLSAAWKTTLSGLLLLGIPEIFMVIAVGVLGKPGFAYLKAQILRFLKRTVEPPETVSRARYRVGLVLFGLPLFGGWLSPFIAPVIFGEKHPDIWYSVGGDVMFILSFFVLGGEFWDKVRALFVHGAKAVFPQ